MITNLKNLFINKPAIFLSDLLYSKYILILSFISSFLLKDRLKNIKNVNSIEFPEFNLFTIEFKKKIIMFQSLKRISRFMKGFENAGNRMWDRYRIDQLLSNNIPQSVIDVGANIGEFSYYARKRFGNSTEIFAIEPDPIAYQCLENNLFDSNIELSFTPLSEFNGEKVFYLKTTSADSSFEKPIGDSVDFKVIAKTLDEVFRKKLVKYPILLKMDVEGHEPEVLRGGTNTLKLVKWISIDTGRERDQGTKDTTDEVVKILRDNRFIDIKVYSDSMVTGVKH
jgi:FkbM family methyltransferase